MISSATCEETHKAILCDIPCDAPEGQTCQGHIDHGGKVTEVPAYPLPGGDCGCPPGYSMEVIINATHIFCHRQLRCDCVTEDGHVYKVTNHLELQVYSAMAMAKSIICIIRP